MEFIRDMWSDGWPGRVLLMIGALVPFLIAGVIWGAIVEGRRCEALGGHIISKTSTGVGPAIGGGGGVAVTTNTVSFCVSQDGRILF